MQRNALLSVYNKTGVIEFAQALVELGFRLFASGGTCRHLAEAGLSVTDVKDLVGGEAILGHKVVTLSRELHAGLLADYIEKDLGEMERLGLPYMDLVAVDLYPLQGAITKPDATEESVRQLTDIGGPTMLRAGAKGRRIVVLGPDHYDETILGLKMGVFDNSDGPQRRREVAAAAEGEVANYVLQSARYLSEGAIDGFVGKRVQVCKYGENAWQAPASLFSTGIGDPLGLDHFRLVAGTAPSYNNLAEIDRQLQTITHIAAGFERNFRKVPLIAIGTKHGNPCGAAVGDDPVDVIRKMVMGDPQSIFGGLVMVNFAITEELAEELLSFGVGTGRRLLDGISAPSFTEAAIQLLRRKGDKCRFMTNPALADLGVASLDSAPRFRYVRGGFLVQPNYTFVLDLSAPEFKWVYGKPQEEVLRSTVLAWAIGSTSNSNTITLVRGCQLVGNGVGQQDRVGAAGLALLRAATAGHAISNSGIFFQDSDKAPRVVAYSDSYFPFPDGVETLLAAGVWTVIGTFGSIKDREVEDAFLQTGLLGWQDDKLARGFFGH